MATEKEYAVKVRALLLLKAIVENPFFYTRKQLADRHQVDESTIKRTFEAFRTAGFEVLRDKRHRYGLAADKAFEHLKSLLVFNAKEEELLTTALQKMGPQNVAVDRLLRKMSRIYDVSKMHNTFDRNFLTKLDKLEKAKAEKTVVLLKDYHSTNSSTVSSRHIEAFHISPEDDIVHAYDLEKKGIRHFRISRIPKLEITDTAWQYEGHHVNQETDCFRIHDNNQVRIHLRLNVGGYNALLETYPVARGSLRPAPDMPDQYDLECKVNHQFYGLSNFIMGSYASVVAIFEPYELIDHIRNEAQKLLDKNF